MFLASEVVAEFQKLSEESFQSDDIGIKINELEEDLMDFEKQTDKKSYVHF